MVSGEWAAVVREGTRLEVGWLEERVLVGSWFRPQRVFGGISVFPSCSQGFFLGFFFGGYIIR